MPNDPDRPRFHVVVKLALLRAIGALPDRDRLRLGCYYREDLTLAQIGRLLGEHEATVSRHLTRTRRAIRDEVERLLRARARHSSTEEIAACFESGHEDPGLLDVRELLGSTPRAQGFRARAFYMRAATRHPEAHRGTRNGHG